jgi:hypothetical protein
MAMATDAAARTGVTRISAQAANEPSWNEALRVGAKAGPAAHPGQRVWPNAAVAGALFAIVALLALLGAGGCAEPGAATVILPNSDPALRKPVAEFRADGASRHPFKSDAPSGGRADGASRIDYTFDTLQLANFSAEDWNDVEVWVNRTHVVHVPNIEKDAGSAKTISFFMLADASGNSFPADNNDSSRQVRRVEILRDGALYDVPVRLAD